MRLSPHSGSLRPAVGDLFAQALNREVGGDGLWQCTPECGHDGAPHGDEARAVALSGGGDRRGAPSSVVSSTPSPLARA